MKRYISFITTLIVASMLVISTSVADGSAQKDDQGAVRTLVNKALDAIDNEAGRIQFVGRSLTDGERNRLDILASAREQLQNARTALKDRGDGGDQPIKAVAESVTKAVKNVVKRDGKSGREGDSSVKELISKALGVLKRDKDEDGIVRKSLSKALKILKRENKGGE